jgi:signal transduction histidine kinase
MNAQNQSVEQIACTASEPGWLGWTGIKRQCYSYVAGKGHLLAFVTLSCLYTTVLTIWTAWQFIIPTLLFIFGIGHSFAAIVLRGRQQQQLFLVREQALLAEKQKAIESERVRIAADLHDDIGSGLTTIHYLSEQVVSKTGTVSDVNEIKRIALHSQMLIRSMSEIIWTMNARYDNVDDLTGYLRRYASEYLEEHNIHVKFRVADHIRLDGRALGPEKRRNLFFVFKEVLHNLVKHSGAKAVMITITAGETFTLQIAECDGKGFSAAASNKHGNGIYNIEKRMMSVGGDISYCRTVNGTIIDIAIPMGGNADVDSDTDGRPCECVSTYNKGYMFPASSLL